MIVRRSDAIVVILGLVLGACGHRAEPPPKVVVQEVRIPIPVKCDAKVSPRPAYPDLPELLKSAPTDRMMQLLYAGRKVRDGYIGELEAAVAGCAKQP